MSTVLIGDSHSQIHFTHIMNLLPNLNVLERHSNPGWSAKSYLNTTILDDLPNATTAIVALGGNNQSLDESFDQTIKVFLNKLYNKGIKNIIWLGPFWSDPNIRADVLERHEWTNKRLKKILPSTIKYIDTFPISEGLQTRDGVHFSSSKYLQMVESILPTLQTQIGTIFSFLRIYKWWLLSTTTAVGIGAYLYVEKPWTKKSYKGITMLNK